MALLAVHEKFAFSWHSKDAETPEANREIKKLKRSVPDKKDAEILEANSRCFAMDSHQDILKKDAETPESKTRRFFDLMKKVNKLKHSMKATNSQPDILSQDAIDKLKKIFEVKKYSGPHPDIFKEDAETLEENSRCVAMNSQLDILKKGAAGVEARSRFIDDWKKKFEKIKNDTNSHPDILKKADIDILKKEIENMEARFQFLDFAQKHSEKLMSSVKVPISTEREESDDEIEYSVVPPLKSPRRDLILEKKMSRHSEDEVERKSSKDDVKKQAKETLERFQSFETVFGRLERWDEARKVFSDLIVQ